MINDGQKLSHNIFSELLHEEPTRDGYGKGLVEAGQNKSVVVLTADVGESTRCHWFSSIYPERFIECGVAEQNMAGIAAGLGISGFIPFINSYATFSPGRNLEQIRTLIAYNDSNVKIAGHHAGLSAGYDGATHQAIEDISCIRSIPNIKVVYPADAIEAQKATVAASKIWGPVYIRLHREKTNVFTTNETPFIIGKAQILWVPKQNTKGSSKHDVTIISTGPMSYDALEAAKELEKQKIGACVLHVPTIKPLDEKTIIEYVKKSGAVVTVEEHSTKGGFGSSIAELLCEKYPVPIEFIGIHDVFGQSGSVYELKKAYGLTSKDIIYSAKNVIKRK